MTDQLQSLIIARLLISKGDFVEGRRFAEEAMQEAQLIPDATQWLTAARFYFQCCQELEEAGKAQKIMDEVLKLLSTAIEESVQAQAETLIGSWLLSQNRREESRAYLQSAIGKATHTRDLDTLARALHLLAFSWVLEENGFAQALVKLEKLDLILSEVENPEVELGAHLLRGYILTQLQQYEKALALLWQSYEKAKLHGFHPLIATILAQLARLYRDQKQLDKYQLYAELALRGTDKTKMPRIYHAIAQACPEGLESLKPRYDFLIDESTRQVKERQKGIIDFKNQHILFDLALLLLKNPGRRYSKEDLMRIIWQQNYDPELHDNLIYVSIKRLRTLLEPDLESPLYILRDRKGYYLNPQTIVQNKNPEEVAL